MDLMKIGAYIQSKRKGLGLTQRQLAEKLRMSDKSVSKWERGQCLPDVSVYLELCGILGISVNEFLAGEDLPAERLPQKAEENLLGVAADGKRKQRRLKIVAWILAAILLLAAAVTGALLARENRPRNEIAPLDQDSAEMKTARLLSGADGACLYRYTADDGFAFLKVYVSVYRAGELLDKQEIGLGYDDMDSPKTGRIAIVPDFKNFVIRLIVADDGAKTAVDIPILEGVPDRDQYGRGGTQIEDVTPIRYNEEQGLLALVYGKDGLQTGNIQDYEQGFAPELDEYVYYFSLAFCKDRPAGLAPAV